jgi:cell filamentation protein
MATKPDEVMGYLAYGHPFLDGNGRTVMVVHSMLAQRAGLNIDWAATDKQDYLAVLTQELNFPGKGILDEYLRPFIKSPVSQSGLAAMVAAAPGLDGNTDNTVLGWTSDPTLRAQYEAQQVRRKPARE